MVTPMKYLENEKIMAKIKSGPVYRKKELTELRLMHADEDKRPHTTHVLDKQTNSVRVEIGSNNNFMSKEKVVARNICPIGKNESGELIYNEWLIPIDKVIKNYGEDVYNQLTEQFKGFLKKATVRAIPITDEIFEIFQEYEAVDEEGLVHIEVPFEPWKMKLSKKDFLTDAEYGIAAIYMDDYEEIPEEIKENNLSQSLHTQSILVPPNRALLQHVRQKQRPNWADGNDANLFKIPKRKSYPPSEASQLSNFNSEPEENVAAKEDSVFNLLL